MRGLEADFNERENCPPADREHERDRAWNAACRRLSSGFLTDILTGSPWREALPFQGISISHARIDGDLDLASARLTRGISIADSLFDGELNFESMKTDGLVGIKASTIAGTLDAASLHSDDGLLFWGSTFGGDLILKTAKVAGTIDMTGVRVSGNLDAEGLQAGDLFMSSDDGRQARFNEVSLLSAKVAGKIEMVGASVSGKLDAEGLQAGELFLSSEGERQASFNEVSLLNARVAGSVEMVGATVSGKLDAEGLQAGELLLSSDDDHQASFSDVSLLNAKVAGSVEMVGANVSGKLDAEGLQAGDLLLSSDDDHQANFNDVSLLSSKVSGSIDLVGASVSGPFHVESMKAQALFARNTKFEKDVEIIFSEISNNLDLRGAALMNLDLSNSSIGGELSLGGAQQLGVVWKGSKEKPSILDLRNAHIGALVDRKDVWPTDGALQLRLEGLKLDRLGGFEGEGGEKMRERSAWWDRWARLDPDYSPAPYVQLVAVMKAAGDSDAADDIQFLGRERAREAICNRDAWSFNCLLQNVLGHAVGYGIGRFTFRALYWVLLISVISTLILKLSVPEAQGGRRSWLWCFGASFSRLIPGIDLSKEFADFFDGPFRPKLNALQGTWFWFVRFAGFVLGAALLAAVAGLTRGP